MLFNGYEIIEKLGEGGYGKVYKAIRQSDNKKIALKVIDNVFMGTERLKKITQEIELLEKVATPNCQPNLACYYGHQYNKNTGKMFIEMELIEGEDLFDFAYRYRNEPLSKFVLYKYLLLITKDLINGLIYVHNKGILHNDIKPDNIMIDKSLTPVLIDFGLGCNTTTCTLHDKKIPCCSTFSGTPEFVPPELYLTETRYPASDIWSLGVTLYAAATGKYPFDFGSVDPSVRDVMQAIVKDTPDKLQTPNTLLNEIVNRAVVKDIDKRITAEEIRDLLASYN